MPSVINIKLVITYYIDKMIVFLEFTVKYSETLDIWIPFPLVSETNIFDNLLCAWHMCAGNMTMSKK